MSPISGCAMVSLIKSGLLQPHLLIVIFILNLDINDTVSSQQTNGKTTQLDSWEVQNNPPAEFASLFAYVAANLSRPDVVFGSAEALARFGTTQLRAFADYFNYGKYCGPWQGLPAGQQCCTCGGRQQRNTTSMDLSRLTTIINSCNMNSNVACADAVRPIDWLDAACQVHDLCYACFRPPKLANHGYNSFCACEEAIVGISQNMNCDYYAANGQQRRWCRFYRALIPAIFTVKPCFCQTEALVNGHDEHRPPSGQPLSPNSRMWSRLLNRHGLFSADQLRAMRDNTNARGEIVISYMQCPSTNQFNYNARRNV